jgi:hypothetical protein
VRLDNGAAYLPSSTPLGSVSNPGQGPTCAAGGVTCTGDGAAFLIALGGAAHTIQFDVFQRGGDAFGLLFQGDLQPVPEPATMLLVGAVLAGVGIISRRRLQKKQD